MSGPAELHVKDALASRLLANGSVMVWPLLGPPVTLSREQFNFLAAFGTGSTAEQAAERIGWLWDPRLQPLADAFVAHGLLDVPPDQRGEAAHDQRNAFGRRLFGERAERWASDAYDAGSGDYFTFNRIDRTLQWLVGLAPERQASVLDLGCGAGHFPIAAGRAGYTVKGIDSSAQMLRLAAERLQAEASDVRARVSFECADARSVAVQDHADFVTALGLLAWFDNPLPVFETARHSVKPGGYFIVDCANKLVTPDGAMWLLQRDLLDGDLLELLSTSRRSDLSEGEELLRVYAQRLLESASGLQKWLESGRAPRQREPPATPAPEHRFSPSDIKALSERTHFEFVALAGVGEARSLWNQVFPDEVATLMNTPLAALRGIPISALWSTGFVVLLKAR